MGFKNESGLPQWLSGKEPTCQCRRHKRQRFDPWVGKIPWRMAWQSTPVFLPGESHDRGDCRATEHGVAKSQTWLNRLSTVNQKQTTSKYTRWNSGQFNSVQLLSCVWLSATPWTAARQASLSITNSRNSPQPMSIESVMPSNHLILCRPLLLLPSIFPNSVVWQKKACPSIRWQLPLLCTLGLSVARWDTGSPEAPEWK